MKYAFKIKMSGICTEKTRFSHLHAPEPEEPVVVPVAMVQPSVPLPTGTARWKNAVR